MTSSDAVSGQLWPLERAARARIPWRRKRCLNASRGATLVQISEPRAIGLNLTSE